MLIQSMSIKNYRVFKEFELDHAARVNLVVGNNNSGKSSLLEAIYLLTSKSPHLSLMYILSERGEYMSRPTDPRFDRRFIGGYLISHIFNGHRLNKGQSIFIRSKPDSQISLSISIKDVRQKEDETPQFSLIDEEFEGDAISKRLVFEQTRLGVEPFRDVIALSDGLISFRNYPRRIPVPDQNSRLVTTDYLPYDDLSTLWDSITLTSREDKVVEALQIVEPKVERISFTSRQSSNSGVLLKFHDEKEPIPLSSMGAGMSRILGIVASLVNVNNGTLLVDEIDTGLYYAVLKDMWRLIFETALKGDSQVFATTHSWDCVRAFQEALTTVTDKSVGRLIRLDRADNVIEAVGYSSSELDIAIKQGIEVR